MASKRTKKQVLESPPSSPKDITSKESQPTGSEIVEISDAQQAATSQSEATEMCESTPTATPAQSTNSGTVSKNIKKQKTTSDVWTHFPPMAKGSKIMYISFAYITFTF